MKRTTGRLEPIPTQEIVGSYLPILRGYLVAAAAYYGLISLSHPFYEQGLALVVLEALAVVAAAAGFWLWRRLKSHPPAMPRPGSRRPGDEHALHGQCRGLPDFALRAGQAGLFRADGPGVRHLGPSRRVALVSVGAALAGLLLMARNAPGDLVSQYGFLGAAGAFAAFGMSTLMRGAVMRELRARLASDALNRKLEAELEENRRLRTEAQDLAVVAQTASRVKTEFLETMSHEIRTPLNGVLGMAQAMERDALSAKQRTRLATIRDSGAILLDVINAVLDISRIEAGKMEIVRAPFDLDALADTLRQLYGGLAHDKGLDFTLEIEPAPAAGATATARACARCSAT
jgi:signal transduction histidine kinase